MSNVYNLVYFTDFTCCSKLIAFFPCDQFFLLSMYGESYYEDYFANFKDKWFEDDEL